MAEFSKYGFKNHFDVVNTSRFYFDDINIINLKRDPKDRNKFTYEDSYGNIVGVEMLKDGSANINLDGKKVENLSVDELAYIISNGDIEELVELKKQNKKMIDSYAKGSKLSKEVEESNKRHLKIAEAALEKAERDGDLKGQEVALDRINSIKNDLYARGGNIKKFELEKGDKVRYRVPLYNTKGNPVDYANAQVIYVDKRKDSNFPIVVLNNGHTARWNGDDYELEDMGYTVLEKVSYAKGGELKAIGDKLTKSQISGKEKGKLLDVLYKAKFDAEQAGNKTDVTLIEKLISKSIKGADISDSVEFKTLFAQGGNYFGYYDETPNKNLNFQPSYDYAKGGDLKAKHVLHIDGQNWFLEKIDSTHFYMSNDKDFRGMAHHIGQHRGEPYYEEVRQWLKDTHARGGTDGSVNYKYSYGGLLGGNSPLFKNDFENLVYAEIGRFRGPYDFRDEENFSKIVNYLDPDYEGTLFDFYHNMGGKAFYRNGIRPLTKHGAYTTYISPKQDVIIGHFFDGIHLSSGFYITEDLYSKLNLTNKKYAKGGVTDAPRIYVASLSDYNAGRLEGEWIDFNDYSSGEEIMERIQEMLNELNDKYKDGEVREEYAIHDYENTYGEINEYSDEDDFNTVYGILEVVESSGLPYEVLAKRMEDTGYGINYAEDDFYGTYDSEEEFAEQLKEDVGISPEQTSYYLYMTEMNARLVAVDEADFMVYQGNLDDDYILDRANKEDEYENTEDIDEKEEILDEAKEIVYDEIYEKWYNGLLNDPVNFLVNEQGIYSEEDLVNVKWLSFDLEKYTRDLMYDFSSYYVDGQYYIYAN